MVLTITIISATKYTKNNDNNKKQGKQRWRKQQQRMKKMERDGATEANFWSTTGQAVNWDCQWNMMNIGQKNCDEDWARFICNENEKDFVRRKLG